MHNMSQRSASQQAQQQQPMQQAQAEPSKLISRAGGKNVTTQLSKGDPEIVQEVTFFFFF